MTVVKVQEEVVVQDRIITAGYRPIDHSAAEKAVAVLYLMEIRDMAVEVVAITVADPEVVMLEDLVAVADQDMHRSVVSILPDQAILRLKQMIRTMFQGLLQAESQMLRVEMEW